MASQDSPLGQQMAELPSSKPIHDDEEEQQKFEGRLELSQCKCKSGHVYISVDPRSVA